MIIACAYDHKQEKFEESGEAGKLTQRCEQHTKKKNDLIIVCMRLWFKHLNPALSLPRHAQDGWQETPSLNQSVRVRLNGQGAGGRGSSNGGSGSSRCHGAAAVICNYNRNCNCKCYIICLSIPIIPS
jgi:hypothetical protein